MGITATISTVLSNSATCVMMVRTDTGVLSI